MTLTKRNAKKIKKKIRDVLEEIVKLLEEEGFDRETAVMLAPETVKLVIDSIRMEMEEEK